MHRVWFIVAVLAITGLVILVWGLLGLWLVTLLRVWLVLWRILALVRVPGRRVLRILLVLLRLLRLLRLILWWNGWCARMQEHGMACVAVLAVGGIGRMARGAVGDKRIAAVSAYPLSPQVLCAAFRAGNCRLVHKNVCKRR